MMELIGQLLVELLPELLLIVFLVFYYIYGLGSKSYMAKYAELLKENTSELKRIADSIEALRDKSDR